jgi:hypothetical protein
VPQSEAHAQARPSRLLRPLKKLDSGEEQGVSNGVSPKQFHNSRVGIVRCRRWMAPVAEPLLLCALRRFGKAKIDSAQAYGDRLSFSYAAQPATTEP